MNNKQMSHWARKILSIFEQCATDIFLIESMSDRSFTYADFYDLALNGSAFLYAHQIRHGDRVALLLDNSAEFAALYFSCLFMGAVAVPINPKLHLKEIEFILTHAGLKLIVSSPTTNLLLSQIEIDICQQTIVPTVEEQSIDSHSIYLDAYKSDNCPAPFNTVQDEDLFSITFTSGTTNLPKGVPHFIVSLFACADAFNQVHQFTATTRVLHIFPMGYMAGLLNTLLSPFMARGSVVLLPAFNAQSVFHFWKIIQKYHINTLWLSPTIIAALLKLDRDPTGKLYCRDFIQTICVGTAPLPTKTQNDFEQLYGTRILESYGLSELLYVSTNYNSTPPIMGAVGKPLPYVKILIVDEDGNDLPVGQDGEVLVQTPYLMAGYLDYVTGIPQSNTDFVWFPTGDVGHLDSSGNLFITARKKDLIIHGGVNVSPRAVEDMLLHHPSIDDVAVIGLPNTFYGEEIVAVVKMNVGYQLEDVKLALRQYCKANLNADAIPTKFIAIDQFPLSSTGKVQKEKLRQMFL